MKRRSLIKSQIIEAWEKSISKDYCQQRINSERSLQASFWAQLNKLLQKNRRLFIEPSLTIRSKGEVKILMPDIVVCNSREVISIVELKYLPRGRPRYSKDIKNMDLIARNRNGVAISNARFRGNVMDGNQYRLSKNILFVWAGVHIHERDDGGFLYSEGFRSLDGCYLQLHAATSKTSNPELYYYQS